MSYKPIIAIDFDGTIVENKFPYVGEIRPYAKEIINRLHKEGFRIVIWTCRFTEKQLFLCRDFLTSNNIWFDAINENLTDFDCKPKIYADIYIDDKQLGGLPSWEEIYKKIHIQVINQI